MADIRCSNCGRDNSDFLDVCQFCQAPLRPDPLLHIGEEPTKKNTDELEEILPDWLKEARQQGKNEEAVDDAFRSQVKPRVPKDEPPDLLAGLMSQADSDEDEVPDWLAGIRPDAGEESARSSSSDEEKPSDFFAQFMEPEPQPPVKGEATQEDVPAWMGMEGKPSEKKDELTDWFPQESAEAAVPFAFDDADGTVPDDTSWMRDLGSFDAPGQEPPAEKEPEDLGWLRDLEAASKGTGELPAPKTNVGFDFTPASSDDDLSWLNNLGGISTPTFEQPASSQPVSSDDDLDWLNKMGGTPAPAFDEPVTAPPALSDDDLGWLKKFGGTPAPAFDEPVTAPPASSDGDLDWLNKLGGTPAPAFEEPVPSQPASSDDDLDWLNKLGGTPAPAFEEPAPAQPASLDDDLSWLNNLGGPTEPAPAQPLPSQDDLSWLNNLGDTSEPSGPATPAFAETGELYSGQDNTSSKPFRTAPLNELLNDNEFKDTTPDWLKSALEQPSMPPPGAVSLDWFSDHGKPTDAGTKGPGVPAQEGPASSQPAFDIPTGDSSVSSAQDMDALFMEMPDWLSPEAENAEAPQPVAESAPPFSSEDETLSPVELPSWVQAMRPIDSAIGETPASADLITEREGPLAGFRGVIPTAPIGSSLRPKAFSMTLQVTDEQQAGASLLEQIIATETIVVPAKPAGIVSSQRVLRWALSALFLIVLSIVIGLGLQTMPIFASANVNELSGLVAGIPDGSPVLVVVDYEPSFAGEMEAAAGPLLDQLALSRGSAFTFVAMSPNGPALVDRLMSNTGISRPAPDGLGYQADAQYFNLGFLPGGSAGVLRFIEDPTDEFSKFQAVILMTDNAETGRVWVEQLDFAKGRYPEIARQPLLLVSSAQSGPLLQPYVSSGQVDIMVNGLYDAAKYELVNVSRPGTARAYWDAFGYGLMMAVIAIVLGSAWNVLMRIREKRAEAEQG